jgi:hypothetical protein
VFKKNKHYFQYFTTTKQQIEDATYATSVLFLLPYLGHFTQQAAVDAATNSSSDSNNSSSSSHHLIVLCCEITRRPFTSFSKFWHFRGWQRIGSKIARP